MAIPAAEPDLSSTVLGRYRLLRRLGAGGMGSVYLARHELLERQVAVKVLHTALASLPNARERFLREALAVSKVHHPGVVEIYDVDADDAHLYFVMELLHGRDLAQVLATEGRLSWRRAGPILVEVAEAIAAAHAAGVVHRDIKPSNCLLVTTSDGHERVKVIDFGIAKLLADDHAPAETLTATGEVFGTLPYMAPELAGGASDDPRADVYALGVMMFQLLTGRLPFEGTALQVVSQHLTVAPPRPRSVEPSIPPAVESIILRALAKHPDDRFPSMRELGRALQAAAPKAASEAPAVARARPSPSTRASAPAPALAPIPAKISTADVIDLDRRPHAPRGSSKTTAYGEEPPPPPMPGEPVRRDPRFLPRPDPPLALDRSTVADEGQGRRAPSSARRLAPVALLAVPLVAIAAALWLSAEDPTGVRPSAPSATTPGVAVDETEDRVSLDITTVPADARVYVDDVLAPARPISIPRSDRWARVRVEADGHDPRTIQVQPLAPRRLEVKLERTKARTKAPPR